MTEELMNFDIPENRSSIIKVIGVGGGGSNAVNNMFIQGIKDVDFVVCNTDGQALDNSPVPVKIQLGSSLTEGRGAGNKPSIGREAAIENLDDIVEVLAQNTKMVFITAGMGGGTGTGAAPVIARAAKELGTLTVAIVTIPFRNEGQRRINQALEGIAEIEKYVDSLLVINNEKIREIYGDLKLSEAFSRADDVLTTAAKGIAEIITVHGYINVDFADVETVMTDSGVAIMGSARGEGISRAIDAVKEALSSPLLNDNDIRGAKNILLNITSGENEITMDEIGQVTDFVQNCAGEDADIIWGNGIDKMLGQAISVTIIATGFGTNSIPDLYVRKRQLDKVPLKENTNKKTNVENTIFEVKDASAGEDDQEEKLQQRIIEFDISNSYSVKDAEKNVEHNMLEKKIDVKKAKQRVENIQKTYQRLKDLNNEKKSEQLSIDDLENEPAYIRKKVELDKVKHSDEKKISKYSLEDDGKKGTKLSDNNRYLHENAD